MNGQTEPPLAVHSNSIRHRLKSKHYKLSRKVIQFVIS